VVRKVESKSEHDKKDISETNALKGKEKERYYAKKKQ
jgi:hypothetical protein